MALFRRDWTCTFLEGDSFCSVRVSNFEPQVTIKRYLLSFPCSAAIVVCPPNRTHNTGR
jgi:hypothetical protein